METICNGKITDASIRMGEHGCLTFSLTIKAQSYGFGYGGYCIGHGCLNADKFVAENGDGLVAMMKIMNTVGVERWENLVGRYIRFIDRGWGSTVTTIGNIIEDKWFNIDDCFKEKTNK
jgi:hypothetical protein